MLAQQNLQKMLSETKLANMDNTDWEEMKEKVAEVIHICVLDKIMYRILDLTMSKEV